MAIKILSGDSTDELSIDPVSKAARVTLYSADGSSASPLTDAQLRATPVPISAPTLPLPSGASTSAKQLADNHQVAVSNFPAVQVVREVAIAPDLTNISKTASGVTRFQNSTTPLAAGAVFTASQWESILGFSSIVINVDADKVGILTIEGGQDGVNISSTVTRLFSLINAGQSYIFTTTSQFTRVKFTNTDVTAQTFLRLQTIFKVDPVGSIFAPVSTPLTPITLGQVVVAISNDGVKTTYSAAIGSLVVDNLATDIFTITGSATKIIRITALFLSATQATASSVALNILKRSSANTGGVSTSLTPTAHDSTSPAATATLAAYTANPTVLGTLVGAIRARKVFIPSTTAPIEGGFSEWTFGDRPAQAIVLRGTSQSISVNLGATFSGGNFSIALEFTEE